MFNCYNYTLWTTCSTNIWIYHFSFPVYIRFIGISWTFLYYFDCGALHIYISIMRLLKDTLTCRYSKFTRHLEYVEIGSNTYIIANLFFHVTVQNVEVFRVIQMILQFYWLRNFYAKGFFRWFLLMPVGFTTLTRGRTVIVYLPHFLQIRMWSLGIFHATKFIKIILDVVHKNSPPRPNLSVRRTRLLLHGLYAYRWSSEAGLTTGPWTFRLYR